MIDCPICRAPIPPERLREGGRHPCGQCRRSLSIRLFPAIARPPAAATPLPAAPSDATCFFHDTHQASGECQRCGRFVCALCRCAVDGGVLCPTCLEQAASSAEPRFARERVLYDALALSLAVLPLLIFYLTLVSAPMAVYFALRHRRMPRALVPRSPARHLAALAIAGLEIAGWAVGLFYLVRLLIARA